MPNKPVIIVTGASRGLGAAVACWLAKAGAGVALAARSEEELVQTAETVSRLGGEPLIKPVDISDPEACRAGKTQIHCCCADRARRGGAEGLTRLIIAVDDMMERLRPSAS